MKLRGTRLTVVVSSFSPPLQRSGAVDGEIVERVRSIALAMLKKAKIFCAAFQGLRDADDFGSTRRLIELSGRIRPLLQRQMKDRGADRKLTSS